MPIHILGKKQAGAALKVPHLHGLGLLHPGGDVPGGGAQGVAVLSPANQSLVGFGPGEQHQQHAQGEHREHQQGQKVCEFCVFVIHGMFSSTVISGIRLEANSS